MNIWTGYGALLLFEILTSLFLAMAISEFRAARRGTPFAFGAGVSWLLILAAWLGFFGYDAILTMIVLGRFVWGNPRAWESGFIGVWLLFGLPSLALFIRDLQSVLLTRR